MTTDTIHAFECESEAFVGHRARRLSALPAGALVCTLAACGSAGASPAVEHETGSLQLGRRSELEGTRYLLDAKFDIAGPESFALDTATADGAIRPEVVPGSYTIEIRPGFQLWADVAVAEVQVAADLVSDAKQGFEIAARRSTLVSYRFVIEGGTLSFE